MRASWKFSTEEKKHSRSIFFFYKSKRPFKNVTDMPVFGLKRLR